MLAVDRQKASIMPGRQFHDERASHHQTFPCWRRPPFCRPQVPPTCLSNRRHRQQHLPPRPLPDLSPSWQCPAVQEATVVAGKPAVVHLPRCFHVRDCHPAWPVNLRLFKKSLPAGMRTQADNLEAFRQPAITSRQFVPIEPVEPSTTTRRGGLAVRGDLVLSTTEHRERKS